MTSLAGHTASPGQAAQRRPAPVDRWAWYGVAHQVLNVPVAVLNTVLVSLVITGLATVPALLIGVPILLGCLLLAVGPLATFERARGRAFLGPDLFAGLSGPGDAASTGAASTGSASAGSGTGRPDATDGPARRIWSQLTDRGGWRAVAYSALMTVWGLVTGSIVLTMAGGGLALALLPVQRALASWSLGDIPESRERLFYAIPAEPWILWSFTALGVLALLLLPYAGRLATEVDRAMLRSLLGPGRRDRLADRVRTLQVSRDRAVQGAEAERRRIERDLHDGAQQRLIALAMDLGMARQKLATSPEAAGALLDSAHLEAKAAIKELRDVARGIHPAVLTDRGLDAAMSALAARCPVPVDVMVTVEPRPPEVIEATAYYVTAEALTNVAKHAAATGVSVGLRTVAAPGRGKHLDLLIEVSDDGTGGATTIPGGGLAGLADRVAAVDGELRLDSPPGGPTVLTVVLPYGGGAR